MPHTRLINKHFCLFFFALFLFVAGDVLAFPLAIVVQGVMVRPYDEVFKGIKSSYGSNIDRIILYGYKGDLEQYVRQRQPSLLFAIGKWALSNLSSINDIPIIYLMVLNPDPSITRKRNIAGIEMLVPANRELFHIRRLIPAAKRVGVIYSPKHSRAIYRDISEAVKQYHMQIIGKEVVSAGDLPRAISSMAGSIDIFIMIPDITLITPDTLHFMALFFLKRSIPVVTFSEKYLKMGAFMAIYPDPYGIGVQAGGLAKKILQKRIRLPARLWPKKEIIKVNPRVLNNLGFYMQTGYRSGARARARVSSNGIDQ